VNLATTSGRTEQTADIASSEGLGGYTVVWTEIDSTLDVYGRRVGNEGSTEPAFPVSLPAGTTHENYAAVAGGSPVTLAVWEQWGTDYDVYGRFLGYAVYLPVVMRNP